MGQTDGRTEVRTAGSLNAVETVGKRKNLNLKVKTFYFYSLVKTMVFT